MKKLRRRVVNSQPNQNEYVIPLWLQEVLQELRSQNREKMVIVSR
jgi:hypothetical protein